jgi:hypothetical protein
MALTRQQRVFQVALHIAQSLLSFGLQPRLKLAPSIDVPLPNSLQADAGSFSIS